MKKLAQLTETLNLFLQSLEFGEDVRFFSINFYPEYDRINLLGWLSENGDLMGKIGNLYKVSFVADINNYMTAKIQINDVQFDVTFAV